MRPDISEFSYGYALTESLIKNGRGLTAAPIFPSLLQEGKQGFDIRLPFRGSALFLQFKLSDCMVSRQTLEVRKLNFSVPFFRVHLRPGKYSQQHSLLLRLEQSGESVFYVAPQFSDAGTFNQTYLNGTIIDDSVFVRPRAIGRLDDQEHHLAFERTGYLYLFSEPKKLTEGVHFGKTFFEEVQKLESEEINDAFFERLSGRLVGVVKKAAEELGLDIINGHFWEKLEERSPRTKIGIISRLVLHCEPIVIGV